MHISDLHRRPACAMFLISALAIGACAGDGESGLGEAEALATTAESPDLKVVPPLDSDVEVVSVVAEGSGCPEGAWDADITKDGGGKRVTVEYRGFAIGGDRPGLTRDCSVVVKLRHDKPVALSATVSTEYRRSGEEPSLTGYAAWNGGARNSVRAGSSASNGGDIRGASFSLGPTEWTECATEHELRVGTSLKSAKDPADPFVVLYDDIQVNAQNCPLAREDEQDRRAAIRKVSVTGSSCPTLITHNSGVWEGVLVLTFFGKRGTIVAAAPYSDRCTLLIDLDVPEGYQFRAPKFHWKTGLDGTGAAKVTATYSYGGTAQLTEWSPPSTRRDGQLDYSLHEVDLWSPSCAEPGKPIQLRVDVDVSLDGSSKEPLKLDLGGRADFGNWVGQSRGGIRDPDSVEWRRCAD